MRPKSFNEVNAEVARLREAGDQAGALDLLTRSEPLFPPQAALTRMLRVEVLAGVGRATEAVDLLREGLDRGYRYRGRWLRHERFVALASQSNFSALVERSDAQFEKAQAEARPDLRILVPERTKGRQLPVLMALHGNNRTIEDTTPSWRSVVADGWTLAVPQSSEIATTPGFFVWNERERAARDVKAHFETLRSRVSIDARRFVLGGLSMGARLALELGLSDRLPARKILAIATWLPDVQALTDLLEPSATKDSRVYVVVGRHDASGYEGSVRFVDHLRAEGATAEIEIHNGGHEEPADMPALLQRALEFLAAG